jgi:putative membrane protein
MRLVTRTFGVCLFVVAIGAAWADDQKQNEPFSDQIFVTKAASGGMAEVELGKIGQMKGTNPEVKTFSERLVTDHTKANDELKTAAREAGVEVPAKPDAEAQKHIDMFREYKGENFDRDFVKHMVSDHEKDVALFERAARECKNPKLKEFATRTLPTLKEHLAVAKKLQETVDRK